MIEIIHRVNHIKELNQIPNKYGVEIDIRSDDKKLVLAHDFDENGDNFNEYIDSYKHELLVANIKESGIEERVITQLSKKNVSDFFLLDTEFPYILQNFEKYGEYLCLRFSKNEGIDTIKNFIGKVKWVWVDTYEDFDLNEEIADVLNNFNLCLVSPSRWGFKNKINHYIDKFKTFDLSFYAVMIEKHESS